MGYGGEIWPVKVVYLACTSRVLRMRPGSMPVHLLLLGSPSSGKSYTLRVVLRLLPDDAYQVIESGSPHALIYGAGDLRHRIVVFGEADSLPASEDNPAASAIRALLQDHALRYDVTIRDAKTGAFRVQHIEREGPTVLVTTAVRRLGEQLDSRLFTIEMPDDNEQIAAALHAQARLELQEPTHPNPALIAFQTELQNRAPWDVSVPFATVLTAEMTRGTAPSRLLRDYARLMSLVKVSAVLRFMTQPADSVGRLTATVDDYETVWRLVNKMYEVTVSGASDRVRDVIEAVKSLQAGGKGEPVTATRVASQLGISVATASRHILVALKQRWLTNSSPNRQAFDLRVGEAVPPASGLPHPDRLRQLVADPNALDSHRLSASVIKQFAALIREPNGERPRA
jgi:hypothetical protein